MARKANGSPLTSKSRSKKRTFREKKKINYEILGIVLIALSIFIGISFFSSAAGAAGELVKSVSMGLLGLPAYLMCFIVMALAIHIIVRHNIKGYTSKYWLSLLLIVMVSVLWHLIVREQGTNYWEMGLEGTGGGYLGGIITKLIVYPFGYAGSILIVCCAILVLTVVVFDISFIKIFKYLFSSIKEKLSEDEEEKQDDMSDTMPLKLQREFKKLKKQMQSFEKDFSGLPETSEKEIKNAATARKVQEQIQSEVQATQQPDEEAINEAIEAGTEVSLLPKKKKHEEIEQIEIEVVNERADYQFPPISLLREPEKPPAIADDSLERTAKKLIETLNSFGVEAKIIDYSKGPTITRYELQPNAGVKISKITNLADDIALNLAAMGIRIELIPGKSAIGIEVPNEHLSNVNIREVIGSAEFSRFKSKLAFAVGKDIGGKPVIADIARMPHLLIAGSTGSGKSVCINTIITSILYRAAPHEVKLVMIDPKVVELGVYNGIPHLLIPVVTDPRKAAGALQWAVMEMTNRYKLFAEKNVRDFKSYNIYATENDEEELPQILIIIDELADLMMVAPNDVEESICRLAQMARAAGMHLVIATQRPSVDVITGIIKANIPSRISFAVSSYIDSRTIIDMGGAEKLLGRGDMLYYPMGAAKPLRVQGAFVDDKEVERVTKFVKQQNDEAEYNQDIIEQIEIAGERKVVGEDRASQADELLPEAIEMALEAGQASVAMYQRRLKVGYQRAARLIDQMEERKIIGPFDGTKPRDLLITRADWNEMLLSNDFTDQLNEENQDFPQ
ncbi:MAG: DNA translocase FtsK [Clostridiaceae bacterium]|nr:DNA translocase FtsK [Clostridiaceae bacterium]